MICLRRSQDSSPWSSEFVFFPLHHSTACHHCESSHCHAPFLAPSLWARLSDSLLAKRIWWKDQYFSSQENFNSYLLSPLNHLLWRKPAAMLWGHSNSPMQRSTWQGTGPSVNRQWGTALWGCHLGSDPAAWSSPYVTAIPAGSLTTRTDPKPAPLSLGAERLTNTVWNSKYLQLFWSLNFAIICNPVIDNECSLLNWSPFLIFFYPTELFVLFPQISWFYPPASFNFSSHVCNF